MSELFLGRFPTYTASVCRWSLTVAASSASYASPSPWQRSSTSS